MRFRILEIKYSHSRPRYMPQYKNIGIFSRWKKVSETEFVNTIYSHTSFSGLDRDCVWSKYDAEKILDEFKIYLNTKSEFINIYPYE